MWSRCELHIPFQQDFHFGGAGAPSGCAWASLASKVFWYKPSLVPGVGAELSWAQTLELIPWSDDPHIWLCLSTTSELTGLSVWILQDLLGTGGWDTLLGLKMFLYLNSPKQAHGVRGQRVLIFQLLAWKEQDKTAMDGVVQCLGQWDRNSAGRRQNDPERTGRKRKKENSRILVLP